MTYDERKFLRLKDQWFVVKIEGPPPYLFRTFIDGSWVEATRSNCPGFMEVLNGASAIPHEAVPPDVFKSAPTLEEGVGLEDEEPEPVYMFDLEKKYFFASGKDAADEYGYQKTVKAYSVSQLVDAFNRESRNIAWVRARGFYLAALRNALLATGLDCSGFIDDQGMSLRSEIKVNGQSIVALEPGTALSPQKSRLKPKGSPPSPAQIQALYAVRPDPEEVQDYMIRIGVLGMSPDQALQELLNDRSSSES